MSDDVPETVTLKLADLEKLVRERIYGEVKRQVAWWATILGVPTLTALVAILVSTWNNVGEYVRTQADTKLDAAIAAKLKNAPALDAAVADATKEHVAIVLQSATSFGELQKTIQLADKELKAHWNSINAANDGTVAKIDEAKLNLKTALERAKQSQSILDQALALENAVTPAALKNARLLVDMAKEANLNDAVTATLMKFREHLESISREPGKISASAVEIVAGDGGSVRIAEGQIEVEDSAGMVLISARPAPRDNVTHQIERTAGKSNYAFTEVSPKRLLSRWQGNDPKDFSQFSVFHQTVRNGSFVSQRADVLLEANNLDPKADGPDTRSFLRGITKSGGFVAMDGVPASSK